MITKCPTWRDTKTAHERKRKGIKMLYYDIEQNQVITLQELLEEYNSLDNDLRGDAHTFGEWLCVCNIRENGTLMNRYQIRAELTQAQRVGDDEIAQHFLGILDRMSRE